MAAVIEPKVTQSSALTLSPLTPGMGMEVGGVDLSKPLDEAMFAAVYDALYRHKLLVFRDQHALTDESYVAFGRRFGDLEVEPWRDTVPGLPIFISAGYGVERSIETWHVDLPFQPRPPSACVLRAVEIPPVGRDTAWADMEAVYDDLSDTMQRFLSGLKAYHCNKSVHGQSAATGRSRPHPSEKDATLLEAEHPVIQTNPVTGRKFVYVNKVFTKAIIGMTPRESTMLLEFLFDQVRDPEYQARVRWFPGTVIMWNNRSCTHRLIVDRPTSERRILHRLSISGGIPS